MAAPTGTYHSEIKSVLTSDQAKNGLRQLDVWYSGNSYLALTFERRVLLTTRQVQENNLVYSKDGFCDGFHIGVEKCVSCFETIKGNANARNAFICNDSLCHKHFEMFVGLPEDLSAFEKVLFKELKAIESRWSHVLI